MQVSQQLRAPPPANSRPTAAGKRHSQPRRCAVTRGLPAVFPADRLDHRCQENLRLSFVVYAPPQTRIQRRRQVDRQTLGQPPRAKTRAPHADPTSDVRCDRRQSRLLSRAPGAPPVAMEILRALAEEGIDAVIIGAGRHESWRGREPRRGQSVRRALPRASRAHRRRASSRCRTSATSAAVAETLRLAGLDVPVLVHADGRRSGEDGIDHRRDAFCGKMSVCNVLSQYGIPYSLTSTHTQRPESPAFREDLRTFAAVCRVVKGLRGARIGAIGARPAAFKTVRYSEKILEAVRHRRRADRSVGDPRSRRSACRTTTPTCRHKLGGDDGVRATRRRPERTR